MNKKTVKEMIDKIKNTTKDQEAEIDELIKTQKELQDAPDVRMYKPKVK